MNLFMVEIAANSVFNYFAAMTYLTRQEKKVLCAVLGLLLVGWMVKVYRTAHPPIELNAPDARKPVGEAKN
ncbi:MAG TPA: hypothetical protein VFM25_06570 [Verrucomicrobiae bacterium]|nr:hypothetical protein [Verrucomicrobiae bacterium]